MTTLWSNSNAIGVGLEMLKREDQSLSWTPPSWTRPSHRKIKAMAEAYFAILHVTHHWGAQGPAPQPRGLVQNLWEKHGFAFYHCGSLWTSKGQAWRKAAPATHRFNAIAMKDSSEDIEVVSPQWLKKDASGSSKISEYYADIHILLASFMWYTGAMVGKKVMRWITYNPKQAHNSWTEKGKQLWVVIEACPQTLSYEPKYHAARVLWSTGTR